MGCTCSGAHKEAAQQPPNLPSVDSSELDPPGHDFVKAWEQHQAGQPLKHYMPRSKLRSFLMYRLPPPLGLATSPSALPTMEQRHRVKVMLADVSEQVHWNGGFEGDQKDPFISQRQLLMVLQHPGQFACLTQHVGACTIQATWRGWAVRKTQVGIVAARRSSQKIRAVFREKCSSTMGAKSHLARLSQYVSNKQGNISDIKSSFQQRALKHAHRRIPLSPRTKARNFPSASETSISPLSIGIAG